MISQNHHSSVMLLFEEPTGVTVGVGVACVIFEEFFKDGLFFTKR